MLRTSIYTWHFICHHHYLTLILKWQNLCFSSIVFINCSWWLREFVPTSDVRLCLPSIFIHPFMLIDLYFRRLSTDIFTLHLLLWLPFIFSMISCRFVYFKSILIVRIVESILVPRMARKCDSICQLKCEPVSLFPLWSAHCFVCSIFPMFHVSSLIDSIRSCSHTLQSKPCYYPLGPLFDNCVIWMRWDVTSNMKWSNVHAKVHICSHCWS